LYFGKLIENINRELSKTVRITQQLVIQTAKLEVRVEALIKEVDRLS
jgi:hypothetical protein